MSRSEAETELSALGAALATLRRERGLSQAEAGARVGMTSQGWGLYESGRRPGLFRPDVQRRLTGALEASPEGLALILSATPACPEPDAAPETGVRSASRAFLDAAVPPSKARIETMQLLDDDLAPWAASGVVLEIDPDRWPRRGQGCVIEGTDGVRRVRLYERADATHLHVRGGPDGLDAETSVARSEVARLAAVIARRDL